MIHFIPLIFGGILGAGLARAVRLPIWPLTGSIGGAGAVHFVMGREHVFDPSWSFVAQILVSWSFVAQILVGAAVGSAVAPAAFRELSRIVVPGIFSAATIISVGLGCGLLTASILHQDPATTALGMVPGGVAEMVAAATALDVNSALVAGMHVVRVVIVVSSLPMLISLAQRFGPRDQGESGESDGG